MSSIKELAEGRWSVALAAELKCDLTIELRLTNEQAEKIRAVETKRPSGSPQMNAAEAIMNRLMILD